MASLKPLKMNRQPSDFSANQIGKLFTNVDKTTRRRRRRRRGGEEEVFPKALIVFQKHDSPFI